MMMASPRALIAPLPRPLLLLPMLPMLLGLAACTDDRGGYPSLAPRPIEREVLRADPAPAAPVDPAPVPLSADLNQIIASAQAADAAFHAALDKGRGKIEAGRGAAEGSEAWVDGQLAYSAADATRAPVSDALAELDRRRQVAIDAGDDAQASAVTEASQQVQALYEAEAAQLAALQPAA